MVSLSLAALSANFVGEGHGKGCAGLDLHAVGSLKHLAAAEGVTA